jgi:hypothetical protein
VLALTHQHKPIDYTSLGSELDRQRTYERAGGLQYLSQINLAIPQQRPSSTTARSSPITSFVARRSMSPRRSPSTPGERGIPSTTRWRWPRPQCWDFRIKLAHESRARLLPNRLICGSMGSTTNAQRMSAATKWSVARPACSYRIDHDEASPVTYFATRRSSGHLRDGPGRGSDLAR